MTDLTAWLPLWERYPELKPEKLHRITTPDRTFWHTEPNGDWNGFRECQPLHDCVVEAMIFRRAMCWLCAMDHEPMLFNAMTSGIEYGRSIEQVGLWSVILCGDGDEDDHPEFVSHDPTEALRLACCKVLEVEP